jgi:hypothetical protein
VFVTNEYGLDIGDPNFDRVVKQTFGEAVIQYTHYDLTTEGAPQVATADRSYVEADPERTSLCPTQVTRCDEQPTRPPATGYGSLDENWIRISGGRYAILGGTSALSGQVVEVIGRLPKGLAWLELSRTDKGELRFDPPVTLPSRLSFAVGGSRFSVESIPGSSGAARLVQDERSPVVRSGTKARPAAGAEVHKAVGSVIGSHRKSTKPVSVETLFQGPNREPTPITLFATAKGWKAATGRIVGAAEVLEPGACGDTFRVENGATAARLAPANACRGTFHTRVLGRRWTRDDGEVSSDTDTLAPAWESGLAEPHNTTAITIGKGGVIFQGGKERDVLAQEVSIKARSGNRAGAEAVPIA